ASVVAGRVTSTDQLPPEICSGRRKAVVIQAEASVAENRSSWTSPTYRPGLAPENPVPETVTVWPSLYGPGAEMLTVGPGVATAVAVVSAPVAAPAASTVAVLAASAAARENLDRSMVLLSWRGPADTPKGVGG